jgi:hypothetical protein
VRGSEDEGTVIVRNVGNHWPKDQGYDSFSEPPVTGADCCVSNSQAC